MSNNTLWNALYRSDIPPEQTRRECDFIEHFMPLESHPAILDLACETGRHSVELAARGYTVTGIDVDPKALTVARAAARAAAMERSVEATFIEADLRHLNTITRPFDGIILFWQSFGFFDNEAQTGIFLEVRRLLREGGRVILDLYNRLYFIHGVEAPVQPEDAILPDTLWQQGRAPIVPFGYEDELRFEERRPIDLFDPHMFTPGEMSGLALSYGLHLIGSCSGYSPETPATPEFPRMQLVFEKR